MRVSICFRDIPLFTLIDSVWSRTRAMLDSQGSECDTSKQVGYTSLNFYIVTFKAFPLNPLYFTVHPRFQGTLFFFFRMTLMIKFSTTILHMHTINT